MTTYAISIKSTAKLGCDDENTLFEMIPKTFKSEDYMHGVLQGLCFGNQIVYSLDEYEGIVNKAAAVIRAPRRVKFVHIVEEV